MTIEEMQKQIDDEKRLRVEACAVAISEVLKNHKCDIRPVPMIDDSGKVTASIKIIAN